MVGVVRLPILFGLGPSGVRNGPRCLRFCKSLTGDMDANDFTKTNLHDDRAQNGAWTEVESLQLQGLQSGGFAQPDAGAHSGVPPDTEVAVDDLHERFINFIRPPGRRERQ